MYQKRKSTKMYLMKNMNMSLRCTTDFVRTNQFEYL